MFLRILDMKRILIAFGFLLASNTFAAELDVDQIYAEAESYSKMAWDRHELKGDYAIKAANLYKLAADTGHLDALVEYGECFWEGFGVEQDQTTAFHCFALAADQGNAHAQCRCGSVLQWQHEYKKYIDSDIADDPEISAYLYKTAADQGSAEGAFYYARCLQLGYGVEQNPEEEAYYLKIARPFIELIFGHSFSDSDLDSLVF
jgi:TPR repeat protein